MRPEPIGSSPGGSEPLGTPGGPVARQINLPECLNYDSNKYHKWLAMEDGRRAIAAGAAFCRAIAQVWQGNRCNRQGRLESCKIMSLAFSPIMMVGAFVLPETIAGITEASATRSPAMPWTRRRSSTTAI
jgi:hypothetical protein